LKHLENSDNGNRGLGYWDREKRKKEKGKRDRAFLQDAVQRTVQYSKQSKQSKQIKQSKRDREFLRRSYTLAGTGVKGNRNNRNNKGTERFWTEPQYRRKRQKKGQSILTAARNRETQTFRASCSSSKTGKTVWSFVMTIKSLLFFDRFSKAIFPP
jgi:hypothetical protein